MGNALRRSMDAEKRGSERTHVKLDWRKRMSDHVAYALLIYTGLQIFVTAHELKGAPGSILPYFALVALVGAIIPACRIAERRWDKLSDAEASDPALRGEFRLDAIMLWAAAIGLPLILTAIFKAIMAID